MHGRTKLKLRYKLLQRQRWIINALPLRILFAGQVGRGTSQSIEQQLGQQKLRTVLAVAASAVDWSELFPGCGKSGYDVDVASDHGRCDGQRRWHICFLIRAEGDCEMFKQKGDRGPFPSTSIHAHTIFILGPREQRGTIVRFR